MTEQTIFISSCSRRELARRRPAGWLGRGRYWRARIPIAGGLQLVLALLFLTAALGAFVAGRGGF